MIQKVLTSAMIGLLATVANAQQPPPAPPPPRPITEDGGQPVGNNQDSRTAGDNGSVLLDNFHLIQKLARFDRERIPERVVHARGVGAHGEFVSYGDQSAVTKAKLFSVKDKKTPVFVRFSTVIHSAGSPEQLRDPRGFSVKFYTEEGNWDLVGNNLPVFFIRDAMKFADVVHSFKPSPITNQQDPNRIFDFLSVVPESTHMQTFLWSDQGTPASLRKMDGFGVHAFKFVNSKSEVTYVKFNWRSMQGLKRFTSAEAKADSARNHSGLSEDLYNAITKGEFPSWELGVQMLKPSELDKFEFDALDATKIWTDVPEVKIGKMTLNKVPDNFFQFTEQVAFDPGMVVPGVEASEDRLLQGRLFSYADTQRYRVGANYLMLPVNRTLSAVSNNNQDGKMNFGLTKSNVNYEPSMSEGRRDVADKSYSQAPLTGTVVHRPIKKPLPYKQAGELYRSFTEGERANLISNLADDLGQVKDARIKNAIVARSYMADKEYGTRLAKAVNVDLDEVKKMISDK